MRTLILAHAAFAKELAARGAVKWYNDDNEMARRFETAAFLVDLYEQEVTHEQRVCVTVRVPE